MDPRLLNDIRAAESCKLVAYRDSRGFWTNGWGHKYPDQTRDWTGDTWTQAQADQQLANDVAAAHRQCLQLLEWPALDTDCRQNAVTELVYNMGFTKWLGFVKTRQAIRAQNWQTAHDELLDSDWESEVHATRADRLANYLLTGAYPVAEAA